MAYITVDQLKTYLGMSAIDTDDALLQIFIDSAVSLVEAEVGFTFEADATTTRYFTWGEDAGGYKGSWEDRRILYFDTWLAAAPTSVTNGDDTAVASSNYVLLDRNRTPYWGIQLKRDSEVVWTYDDSPEDSIQVVGLWGWSQTPPADVVQLTYRIAAYFYRQKDSQVFDHTAFTELGRIQVKAALPNDAMSMLKKYVWRTR